MTEQSIEQPKSKAQLAAEAHVAQMKARDEAEARERTRLNRLSDKQLRSEIKRAQRQSYPIYQAIGDCLLVFLDRPYGAQRGRS
jgi:hypothetical protein